MVAGETKPDIHVPMMVTRGLPMSTQLLVDDHRKRTVIDVSATIRGLKDTMTNRHVAVARVLWLQALGLPRDTMTNEQMILFIRKYWEGIDFSVSHAFQGIKKPGVTQAGVLAVVAQAYLTGADRTRLIEFGELMLTGDKKSDRDKAGILLREWLWAKASKRGGSDAQLEVYRKAQRALFNFLRGLPLEKLYETREQMFPMMGTRQSKGSKTA